ncbi:hypothetical protein NA56DRAFT_597135 [Hyaloscypha hepaticicola]|uniref:Uncharacterized protein n=1 Tax=Hyaloscypha hepaticicola TaxID=2082293 RepID=A0A2J6QAR6_9HELO|nr:hypothetical protein NA56DRAFT_597135 [Hyaloscypha hepaticicola]
MCHNVTQIFDCGHSKPSKRVKCKKPTSKCGGVFLRQELENTKGLCLKSVQQEQSIAAAGGREDEGYWS